MDFKDYFSIWDKLAPDAQQKLTASSVRKTFSKGMILEECSGLYLVRRGRLRAYVISEEGREVTLYRLLKGDVCLFSASCMRNRIDYHITIEPEIETEVWMIPVHIYKELMETSAPIANYTNELMASRFSEVMWLMDQILWKRFDSRLAQFLLEEAKLEQTENLKLTHETIGNHMGNAREVVTRMLRYFQDEGMVTLSRGTVTLTDIPRLEALIQE